MSELLNSLRKKAKILAKIQEIKLSTAQDEIAKQNGHRTWSLMVSQITKKSKITNLVELYRTFCPGTVNVIGARPGMGKTSFAIGLAAHCASNRCKVKYINYEYAKDILAKGFAQIVENPEHFEVHQPSKDEDIFVALEVIAQKNCLIIIDYFQLIPLQNHTRNADEFMQTMIVRIKKIANDKKCTFVILSQVNRAVEARQNKLPNIDDIELPKNKIVFSSIDSYTTFFRSDFYDKSFKPQVHIYNKKISSVESSIMALWNSNTRRFEDKGGISE